MPMRELGLILIAAAVVMLVARPLRMPSIVAYLLAGLALGPGLRLVEKTPIVQDLSELGIALLLFLVGLELTLDKIRKVGKVAVLAGLGQVVFTAAGGLVLCRLLGYNWMESLFLATALTFSSTVVVVKLLDQKRELDSLYGRIAVGIFLVQDMVVIVVLTILSGLARQGQQSNTALQLAQAFGGMLAVLLLSLAASRWVLPGIARWLGPDPSSLLVFSLAWCLLAVQVAHMLGISAEIGAFLAGLSLAQVPASHDLQRRVHPLMNFFIAVFFVSLGIEMDLSQAVDNWFASSVLALFVLIGNPLIFILIILGSGYSRRTSTLTALTVAQISEFSFVFVATGLSSGLVDSAIMSVTALVGVITITLSAFMILYNHKLFELMKGARWWRLLPDPPEPPEEAEDERDAHVVVVGMNELGRSLVKSLAERDIPTLAIDTDPRKLAELPGETLLGNIEYPSVLEAAGLRRARAAVTALQIEPVNRLFVYRCRRLGIPVAAHGFDASVIEGLKQAGADYVIDSKAHGLEVLTSRLKELGALPS